MTAGVGCGDQEKKKSMPKTLKARARTAEDTVERLGNADHPECLMVCPDFVLGTLSMAVGDLVERALEPLDLRLRHYRLLRLLFFEGARQQSSIGPVLAVQMPFVWLSMAILAPKSPHTKIFLAEGMRRRKVMRWSLPTSGEASGGGSFELCATG